MVCPGKKWERELLWAPTDRRIEDRFLGGACVFRNPAARRESAWPLLPFVVPFAFVANVIYGFKTWQGEDVRIPIITDLVEERLPAA